MIESLTQLLELMRRNGAHRIYAKRLSPNDNSKNQVYLGGDFSALNVIPHGDVYVDSESRSQSKRYRSKAAVAFYWVDEKGMHVAPDANLILYPKYPEVRMSGFLRGCRYAPSAVMSVRDEGRVLILGITRDGKVIGYAASADDPIAAQVNDSQWPVLGVFLELPLGTARPADTRRVLLEELRRIYGLYWIHSQRLAEGGAKIPYTASNAGGYTLEAELGISPNGYAEPDFMGWEVKQYGVRDFTNFAAKSPVTLMTPEPDGGIYKHEGVQAFLRRYGYPDRKKRDDRVNFGGTHVYGQPPHRLTALRMTVHGYDEESGQITDFDGGFKLVDSYDEIAASWTFRRTMAHWNRKHAQAAYVPSLYRAPPPQYRYGPKIMLGQQTDFLLFVRAFISGKIYYDPGIKMELSSSTNPRIKRRSQFRIRHADLADLYHAHEIVSLDD